MLRFFLLFFALWAGYYFVEHPRDIAHPVKFLTYSKETVESVADTLPFATSFGEQAQPPGVLVPEVPSMFSVRNGDWKAGNYTFTPMYGYRIRARVLSKAHYIMGRETDVSPYDLVLGWQEMSDSRALSQLSISQGNRWYHYNYSGASIAPNLIPLEAGNMHMIPGNDEILQTLRHITRGNIVDLEGYLVDIRGADGWDWRSGTGASSEGAGGCKVIWINGLSIER